LRLGALFRRPSYGWTQFMGDCFGGVIAALIALPYGLAMAAAMGLPPVLGIFTSILTAPVTAILGRNPMLIGGTGSATVPFIALAVQQQGIGGAAKVSIVAAIIMMAFCVARLGRLITKVPHAVVTGFSCGVGGLMLISQLDIILGIASPLTRSGGSALNQLVAVIDRIQGVKGVPLAIGSAVILAAILSARWFPRAPAPLIGVLIAVGLAKGLGFHGSEIGALASGLPPFVGFSWSFWSFWSAISRPFPARKLSFSRPAIWV